MRTVGKSVLMGILPMLASLLAQGQSFNFHHIVIIVQENRTPDNLFQGLCISPRSCSITPTSLQYNIQTSNWLDKTQISGVTQPLPIPLNTTYDLNHAHGAFVRECDLNTITGVCRMDGAAKVSCGGTCPTQPQFRFVDNSTGAVDPYLQLARQYGFANFMFQTNQGPSFPAHQFLFGGTSAPTTDDDLQGIFAAENVAFTGAGCIAVATTAVPLIVPPGIEKNPIFPCFEHNTIPDVLPANVSWRYYTPSPGSIWTAPDAIKHICQPDAPASGKCVGPEWVSNVDLKPADVLTDIANCNLRNLTWVIPAGQNSDHPHLNTGGGPSWVASIVNAIGQSPCKDFRHRSYWEDTAIIVTWDDWGGWYDHEPPTILPQPQGDYQYGFRVPLLVVSAFTRAGYIDNGRHDFGSILRFVENNFRIPEGILTFADARSHDNLSSFFNFALPPRPFVPITAQKPAASFINDTSPALDPDDD